MKKEAERAPTFDGTGWSKHSRRTYRFQHMKMKTQKSVAVKGFVARIHNIHKGARKRGYANWNCARKRRQFWVDGGIQVWISALQCFQSSLKIFVNRLTFFLILLAQIGCNVTQLRVLQVNKNWEVTELSYVYTDVVKWYESKPYWDVTHVNI